MKLCNIAWRLAGWAYCPSSPLSFSRLESGLQQPGVAFALALASLAFASRVARRRSPMRRRCNAPTHVRQCTRVLHDAHAFMVDRTTSRSGPHPMASRSWLLGCCFVERCRMREMSLSISVSSIASGPVLQCRSRRLAQALHGRVWPERRWL